MSGFRLGQLVQVIDPRHLAYGRIAMVLCSKKGGRSQVRFADLPKGVGASPDPTGFVNIFDDDELTPLDLPIAPYYALVTNKEQIGERQYSQYCLVHGESEAAIDSIAQEVARTWYGDGGQWDETIEAYWVDWGATVALDYWNAITLAQYAHLRQALTDCTPVPAVP